MLHKKGIVISTPPNVLHFSRLGKPLKSPEGTIISWAKFNKTSLAWVAEFRAKLEKQQGWSMSLQNSFLGPHLLNHSYNSLDKVTVYGPNIVGTDREYKFTTDYYDFKVLAGGSLVDIMEHLTNQIITADAAFHTWPDETGKFKIYTSKASQTARFKFKQPDSTTFINRNNLSEAKTWAVLKHYIEASTAFGSGPQRKDICDLVKQISNHKVDKTQEIELVKMGIDVTPDLDLLDEDNE